MRLSASVRLAVAGWLATMLASMTIFPLVQGGGWWLALGVVAAVTSGAGLLVRRFTSWGALVVAAQVVVWAVAMTMIFLPDQAYLSLFPGPDAIASGNQLFELGLRVMHRAAPPVDDTPGVIFVTAGGLTLVALVVDALAVTLRRPAVAGLPLLAVYCVPAAVLPDGLPWPYFLLAALGFLLLVGVDSVDRVQAWGRVLSGTDADGRSSISFGGARKIASASLALAVLVPVLVPGLGERVLGQRAGTGTGKGSGGTNVTVLDPILQLRQNLAAQSDAPVITYQSTVPNPQPLRIVTDDVFDGDTWRSSLKSVPLGQRPQDGAPDPEGLNANVPREEERTDITVGGLAEPYLPLPYPWKQVDVTGNWYYDDSTRTVVGVGQTSQNLHYTVDHFLVDATPDNLRSAPTPNPAVVQRYTQLPRLDPEIRTLTAQHATGATAFDRAESIRNWLRTFTYSLQAPGNGNDDSGQDAMLQFLQERTGYCIHFASAMAVMARIEGIPARVAVGFLPGTRDATKDSWTVRLKDAHAWPELYFQGYGWVRFEPTPPARTQNVGDVVGGGPGPAASATANPTPTATASGKAGRIKPEDPYAGDAGANPVATPVAGWRRVADALPWAWIGGGLLVLLLLASPAAALALARRSRWRGAVTREQRAEAAFDELGERLADLGLAISPASTPRGIRQWLVGAEHVPPSRAGALDRLVAEIETARYAPPGGEGPPVEQLQADVREVVAAAAEQVPANRRRMVRLVPPSGIAVLSGAARHADLAAGSAGRRVAHQVDEARKRVGSGRKS